MIERIDIQGLRGILLGSLPNLTAVSVLVGKNGTGKSTILDALELTASLNTFDAAAAILKRRTWSDPQLSPEWLVSSTKNEANLAITQGTNGLVLIVRKRGGTIEISSPNATHAKTFVSGQSGSAAGSGGGNQRINDIQPPLTRFIDLRGGAATRLPADELYSTARKSGRKKFVLGLLHELIPDVEDVEILVIEGRPTLCLSYADRSVPLSLSGDGIRNIVMLALELGVPNGSLVLIEEPETHLHYGAMAKAADAIMRVGKSESQVVLATHSLEFIDALIDAGRKTECLSLLSVHRLSMASGTLSVSSFAGEDLVIARNEVLQELR